MLIREIRNHGLEIEVIDGALHVRPHDRITAVIRQSIQEEKSVLLNFLESYEEWAAMMEFDAGLSRQEVNIAAYKDCMACIVLSFSTTPRGRARKPREG